jgi:hypothetical protein
MTSPANSVEQLERESRAAVREARARSHLARGYEALRHRDADGSVSAVLPYSDEAIRHFEAAHARDPDDVGAVHHLAVARHARAWDWELNGDPRAAAEWEEALGHWRTLAASGPFWAAQKAKLLDCDPAADAAGLDALRAGLLEDLLDIHVEFVRHYSEADRPADAERHVGIIARARIPPALKTRLVARVFDAMTGAVPDAKARAAYAAALTPVERFLRVFPDHLPALRLHVELCKEWVNGLSYQGDWGAILTLARRAEPFAARLAAAPDLARLDALARAALVDLASEMALRGSDRSRSSFAGRQYSEIDAAHRAAMDEAFSLGLTWGRLGAPHAPAGSFVIPVMVALLYNHAFFLHARTAEAQAAKGDTAAWVAEALPLYRQALSETREGLGYAPDDEDLAKNLRFYEEQVARLEEKQTGLDLFGDWGGRE